MLTMVSEVLVPLTARRIDGTMPEVYARITTALEDIELFEPQTLKVVSPDLYDQEVQDYILRACEAHITGVYYNKFVQPKMLQVIQEQSPLNGISVDTNMTPAAINQYPDKSNLRLRQVNT